MGADTIFPKPWFCKLYNVTWFYPRPKKGGVPLWTSFPNQNPFFLSNPFLKPPNHYIDVVVLKQNLYFPTQPLSPTTQSPRPTRPPPSIIIPQLDIMRKHTPLGNFLLHSHRPFSKSLSYPGRNCTISIATLRTLIETSSEEHHYIWVRNVSLLMSMC